jgi:hypothetical protein
LLWEPFHPKAEHFSGVRAVIFSVHEMAPHQSAKIPKRYIMAHMLADSHMATSNNGEFGLK